MKMDTKWRFLSCLCVLGLFIASIDCQQFEIAGSNITLPCGLQGSVIFPTWSGPPSSTRYIQEGQETNPAYPWVEYAENQKDLVIRDAKPEYSGDYVCEKVGVGSSTVSLSVMAKPIVQLANKTTTEPFSRFVRYNIITGFEDKNLTVSCSATGGRPEPHLEILVNNTAIEDIDFADERTETKQLESDTTKTVILQRTFTAKRKYDMTEISCKATNSDPSNILGTYAVEDTSTIYLSLKPLVHSYSGGGSTMVGEGRNFSCEAQMGRPPPTLTWSYDGQPVSADRFMKYPMAYVSVQEDETVTAGQIISLKNATRDDNKKKVTVTISHVALDVPYTGDMEVFVNFGPSNVTISGNKPVYAEEGATLTLTCTTDLVSFPSNYTIKWMNDTLTKELWYKRRLNRTDMWVSTPGEYNAFYVSENITLSVDRYMDGQSLSCETSPAEDWHKTVLDTVVLDIDYAPIIIEPYDSELRVAEDEEVTLVCSAWSKPPATFSWYKEGSNVPLVVDNGTVKRNAVSYTIPRGLKSLHNGTYRCVASNKEGQMVEKQIDLIVSDGPAVPVLDVFRPGTNSITIHYISPELHPAQLEKLTYHLQYRSEGSSWHEVMLAQDRNEFKLNHLKPGTKVELRLKATNRDGSTYTSIVETRTLDDAVPADNITQKDVNIAIIVSVIVTAAVVLIVVGIIAYFCRQRQSFDPSKKFEMDARSHLKT